MSKIKRVNIGETNYDILKKLAEDENLTVSEMLDKLMNYAIIKYNQEKIAEKKTPLFIWSNRV